MHVAGFLSVPWSFDFILLWRVRPCLYLLWKFSSVYRLGSVLEIYNPIIYNAF
jgi:hypothetical protein